MNATATAGTAARAATAAADRRAYLLLALMVVLWAVNFSVAKVAMETLTPLALNALRFPFAAVVVLLALRREGPIPLPRRGDVGRIIVLGLLGNVAYQQFFIFGLSQTQAGLASVLLAGTPIVTASLSHLAGHERVGARTWAGVAATFCGILIVVHAGAGVGGGSVSGNLLMVGASLCWAMYTVGSRPLIARYGSVQVTAWTLWTGTVVLLLIGLPDLARTDIVALPLAVWGAVFYAGALSVGLAYLIWYNAVRQIGNARTGVFSNLVPAVAMVVAWLWLNEVPTPGQLLGATVIIGGVTLAQQRRPGLRRA
jgi:drug/metabolite transporter (DMT)-like permease